MPNGRLRGFVLDPGEQLLTELAYRLGTVEGQALVHPPTREMARLTARLENGLYVSSELNRGVRWLGTLRGDLRCGRSGYRRWRGSRLLLGGRMRAAGEEHGDGGRPAQHHKHVTSGIAGKGMVIGTFSSPRMGSCVGALRP